MNRSAVLSVGACAAAMWAATVAIAARQAPAQAQVDQDTIAPLALARPPIPAIVWKGWSSPLDRFVSAYLGADAPEPAAVSDARFARRAYLDAWGLLPTPAQLQAFTADPKPAKRAALVDTLLADNDKYADHWISFWNDLLRNEEGVSYFSETAGRKSITDWLLAALRSNLAYDQFVTKLLNPTAETDPQGFLIGVNWRGATTPAVTPWMQAAQNTAQVFLGINLKCNACHDSFVSKWKLRDAYALAAYFSPDPKLQLYRCEVAQNRYAVPAFLFPEIGHEPPSDALADRRAAAAATFTDPRNGRLPRTLVNRIWQRLLGHGIVANPDEMDGRPWSPELLDFLAGDFVDHQYDVKYVIRSIMLSRAYQMPAATRTAEPAARDYAFTGPEVRRLTAEQFADAVGAITGEWNVYPGRPPTAGGVYGREWRVASSNLSRALGRPIRDQVNSVRAAQASTLQALELVNGAIYTRWLSRGARRMLGELPPEPVSLLNRAVSGRTSATTAFDVDVSKASTLWLVVQENGSNVPEVIQPAWAQARFDGLRGTTPLSSLTPRDGSGLRPGTGPVAVGYQPPAGSPASAAPNGDGVRVANPSVLVYDIAGKGFERFRGFVGIENAREQIGSTLNPQIGFFVFDAPPDMERLIPPVPGTPLPQSPPLTTAAETIARVFWYALGRAPSVEERRAAETALHNPAGGTRPSAQGLADLLWAVTMKPEFQLIY